MEIPHEEAQRLLIHYQCESVVVLFLHRDEEGARLGIKTSNSKNVSQKLLDDAAIAGWKAMGAALGEDMD